MPARPAAASAVLSALVVKASFFLLLRLWFEVLPRAAAPAVGPCWRPRRRGDPGRQRGALRQARLKLLIAYSTVAQIGYLFLVFPLRRPALPSASASLAWTGAVLQLARMPSPRRRCSWRPGYRRGAMGMTGSRGWVGSARVLPVSVVAFGLAGLSLMGLPPSGGFIAKWLLLTCRGRRGHWWWSPRHRRRAGCWRPAMSSA